MRSLRLTRSRSADGAHGVEHDHARQLHVGDEDVLIGRAAHLEPLRLIADRRGGEEVVALAAGEGDREAAVPVGAHGSVHATGDGGRGDVGILERIVVVAGHLTADDVELLGGRDSRRRDADGEEGGDEKKETTDVHECDLVCDSRGPATGRPDVPCEMRGRSGSRTRAHRLR